MLITATFDPADDKIRLSASSRLDAELYARVKAAGFRWAPKQEVFYAVWNPAAEDLAYELAGNIDDEDTTLVERAEERADRFEGYQENRVRDADQAHNAVAAIADNIPFGQPILIGHHSERHARKDAERIENGMRKAVKMWETAKYWKSRAAGAIAHAKYLERPDVRHRRIKTIEADKRKQERYKADAEKWLALWSKDGLTLEQARTIANYGRLTVSRANTDGTPNTNGGWRAYDVLQDDESRYKACPAGTVEQCQEAAHRSYPRTIAHCDRWISHFEHRLEYERTMLGETGFIVPPKAPTKAVLPLLNYPGTVEYRNPYRREETVTTEAHPMTQAEFAAINKDYKGTRISADGTHRVRTAYVRIGQERKLVTAFLTDAKRHPKPTGEIPQTRAEQEVAQRVEKGKAMLENQIATHRKIRQHNTVIIKGKPQAARPEQADDQGAQFKAMKETLKAGVQVVTAPQLFPTPPELAARMVELAEIETHHEVLEPSAGTGVLLAEIYKEAGATVVAVEINPDLARRLESVNPTVHCADFLQWDNGKPFDRILMNPPFANGADIEHIEHALTMLKPGGRLVAICANGPRQQEKLRPLASSWEDLPAGTFKEQGTGVNTALLVIG